MRPIAWFYILPTLAALAFQVRTAVAEGGMSTYRLLICGLAAAALVFGVWLGRRATTCPWVRLFFPLSASGVLWVTILDYVVSKQPRAVCFGQVKKPSLAKTVEETAIDGVGG